MARLIDIIGDNVPILVRLHDNDPNLQDYLKLPYPNNWTVTHAEHCKCAGTWEWAFERFPDEKFYGFIGDDCLPEGEKWWEKLELAAGAFNIAYPDDGIHGARLCTHPCIGGDLVRAVGFWALPGLDHNFIDTFWKILGENCALLRYVPEVKFNHQHPIRFGKHLMDDVYKLGSEKYNDDMMILHRYIDGGFMENLVRKIRCVQATWGAPCIA